MSKLDLTGDWTGEYAYPGGSGTTTPFAARIEEHNGVIRGHIVEPNLIGPTQGELNAIVHGHRDGISVDFTKTYDGASDAAHSVDYAGRLSDDGSQVTGVWSLAHLDGSFEMYRDLGAEEYETVEEAVEIPQP